MNKKENSGIFLKSFIEENNVSQTEIAKKIGVSPGMIGQWLRGERPISVAKSLDIETNFKIDAAKLCNDVKLVRNHKRVRAAK